jgi:hypothetical protein
VTEKETPNGKTSVSQCWQLGMTFPSPIILLADDFKTPPTGLSPKSSTEAVNSQQPIVIEDDVKVTSTARLASTLLEDDDVMLIDMTPNKRARLDDEHDNDKAPIPKHLNIVIPELTKKYDPDSMSPLFDDDDDDQVMNMALDSAEGLTKAASASKNSGDASGFEDVLMADSSSTFNVSMNKKESVLPVTSQSKSLNSGSSSVSNESFVSATDYNSPPQSLRSRQTTSTNSDGSRSPPLSSRPRSRSRSVIDDDNEDDGLGSPMSLPKTPRTPFNFPNRSRMSSSKSVQSLSDDDDDDLMMDAAYHLFSKSKEQLAKEVENELKAKTQTPSTVRQSTRSRRVQDYNEKHIADNLLLGTPTAHRSVTVKKSKPQYSLSLESLLKEKLKRDKFQEELEAVSSTLEEGVCYALST